MSFLNAELLGKQISSQLFLNSFHILKSYLFGGVGCCFLALGFFKYRKNSKGVGTWRVGDMG